MWGSGRMAVRHQAMWQPICTWHQKKQIALVAGVMLIVLRGRDEPYLHIRCSTSGLGAAQQPQTDDRHLQGYPNTGQFHSNPQAA